MTTVICDMCECILHDGADRVNLILYGPAHDVQKDFCVACAARVNNKLQFFIAEAKKKEDERKACPRQI